jgi:hypothetical protein
MFKIAGTIMDCYDDPDFIEHPNTVALFGSEIFDFDTLERLGDRHFAIKIASNTGEHRRFPIYNELITNVSCQYLEDNKDTLPDEIVKSAGFYLGKACDQFGIDKTATVAECTESRPFRVVLTDEPNEELLLSKEATQRLFWKGIKEQFPEMTPLDRVATMTEIYKAAGAYAIEDQALWDYVPKDTLGPDFDSAIRDRHILANDTVSRTMWKEAEATIRSQTPLEGADTLATFDKLAGHDERYKDGLTDPYKACFGGFPLAKEAARIVQHGLTEQYGAKEGNSALFYRKELNTRFPSFDVAFDKHAEAIKGADMSDWDEIYVTEVQNHFKLDKDAGAIGSTTMGAVDGAMIGSIIPGVGTAIGAGAGAAFGLGKSLGKKKKVKGPPASY